MLSLTPRCGVFRDTVEDVRVLGVLLVVTACKPKQPPPQSPPIFKASPDAATVGADALAVDAPPVDAPPVTAARPTDLSAIPPPVFVVQPRPAVRGMKAKLAIDKQITLGGIELAYKGGTHGDRIGLSPIRGYTFQVAGATYQITTAADDVEGETASSGKVLVFRQPQPVDRVVDIKSAPFEVTLLGAASASLEEDACAEAIAKAARAAGLPEQSSTSHTDEGGIVALRSPMYRGWCGRHTKRVWIQTWFSEPPPVEGTRVPVELASKSTKNGLTTYELALGGTPVAIHGTQPRFDAELVVNKALVVVRALGNDTFEAVRVANRAPAVASPSECVNRIDALTNEARIHEIEIPGTIDGVSYLVAKRYRAACGLFTRRVWLEPP